MENTQKKSQEEMVQEAVKEAKKAAEACEKATETEEATETVEEAVEAEAAEKTEETAETETAEETEETAENESKVFFGKKKKDKKDEKIEELTDRLMRQMAEFDNFRKRSEKEKAARYDIGAKDVIEKILPVVDNFERGLAAVAEDQKEDPFVQGVEMTYKQLMTALEGLGVKPIEAVGEAFNPDFHHAVMQVEDPELGESVVAEEFQKGYMYKDSVVRYSMVKVAN